MKVCLGAIHLLNLFLIHDDDQVTSAENFKCGRPEWTRTIDLRNVNATL